MKLCFPKKCPTTCGTRQLITTRFGITDSLLQNNSQWHDVCWPKRGGQVTSRDHQLQVYVQRHSWWKSVRWSRVPTLISLSRCYRKPVMAMEARWQDVKIPESKSAIAITAPRERERWTMERVLISQRLEITNSNSMLVLLSGSNTKGTNEPSCETKRVVMETNLCS